MKIIKSNPTKPIRVLIYGVEGIGKSTLGAKSDSPIFITPEGGADQLTDAHGNPVDIVDGVTNWDTLRKAVSFLINEEHSYKTLVLDSADWIEKICHSAIIGKSGKSISTVNGGYGAGYRQSEIMHKEFIDDVSKLRETRGMNIVITAHAAVKPVKDPSMMTDYDSFEIKCHEMVSSLWREYVDALLFARFRTFVKESDDTAKARALSDGTRVVYTRKQPSFQAKNRYGMPPEIEFTENFWSVLKSYQAKPPSCVEKVKELYEMVAKLKDTELQDKALASIEAGKSDFQKLEVIEKRLLDLTKE